LRYGCVMICFFVNCADLGDTSRIIEIYRAVRKRGCKPIVASHGGPYEFLLRQEQVPYTRLEPFFSNERAERFLSMNRMENLFGEFYEAAELRDHVVHEIEFFKSRSVRLVHGGFTLSNSISARVVRARYSVSHGMAPLIFERKMQPWPDELDWRITRLIPESIKRSLVNWAMLHSKRFAGPFNCVSREFGVAPFKSFLEIMLGDFTYITETPEVIGISPEEFESWKPAPSLYSRPMAF
jgi:UDP:flavonoid glycosyltransferase YjiC (YdhE family)